MAESQTPPRPNLFTRIRSSNAALCVALLGALGLLVGVVNWHYPVVNWLFWRYLQIAGLAVFWTAGCLSFGAFILDKVQRRETDALNAVLAFPLGVLCFQLAIFLLGLLGLLSAVTFVLLPAAFAATGARKLVRSVRALAAVVTPPRGFVELAVVLFGLGGVALIYFQILSPETFHWDARWYHLSIAQQYALQGSIRRFPEGWWLDGQPHSASLIYTWAFLLPRALLWDRLELCVHLEFVVFLATIASIPTLVRALVPGLQGRGTWAAIFLFPGIFLYDANLACAADHIAALWCIPVILTLIQVWKKWDTSEAILFGAFMGATLAAKFSAWSMLAFPGLLFMGRAAWLGGRRILAKDRSATSPVLVPFAIAGGVMLLISAQHWLRNWIWYGDPLFPILHDYFHERPWSTESLTSYNLYKSFTSPPLPGWPGVRDALLSVFTFAFIPNDWPIFHRNVPVFGFLFTLSMFCVPFIRASGRLLLTYVGIMMSIVFWYLTTHQDRYLQAWLPAMVACTMATFGLVWDRRTFAVRGLVAALVALQVIWGGDIPFFPTHNMVNDSPIRAVSNFLASGFLRRPDRLRLYGDEGLIAERLPHDAVLMMHETNMHVGFGVRTVVDQWQGRLSYATLGSPAAIYREFADMKVTHMGWETKMSGWNSVGHDMAFLGLALNYGLDHVVLGQFHLTRFPTPAPTFGPFNGRVAVLACANPYTNGMYKIGRLLIPEPGQAWASPDAPILDLVAAVHNAGFLVVDPGCTPALPPEVATQFHPPVAGVRGPLQFYIRRK